VTCDVTFAGPPRVSKLTFPNSLPKLPSQSPFPDSLPNSPPSPRFASLRLTSLGAQECGAWGETGSLANASCLYYRDFDVAYASSIGGITWPRGFVAAGAFYNYDVNVNVSSPEFVQMIYDLNDSVQARGSLVCSSGKVCDYLSEGSRLYDGITDEMVGVMGCML